MSNSNFYKIELIPYGPFFFRGERKTGQKDEYFQHSRLLPQQTSVLGLLREQVLRQTEVLVDEKVNDTAKAEIAVGVSSFNLENESQTKYGIIEQVSPLFVQHDGGLYMRSAVDTRYNPISLKGLKVNLNGIELGNYQQFEKFDPKNNHPQSCFVPFPANGFAGSKKQEDIFTKDGRVGIKRNEETKTTGDEGYFKQTYQRFKRKGDGFVFFVKLNTAMELKPSITNFGAEKTLWSFIPTAIDEQDYPSFEKNEGNTFVLLSDAYVKDVNTLYSCCTQVFSDSHTFLNYQNKLGKHHGNDRKPTGVQTLLLKAGSVFYTNQADKLISIITSPKNFRAIGYNFLTSID